MNKYYVYVHYRLDTNEPFYVGKGSGYRAWATSKRNSHWNNVKNKHGFKVELIFENLTEEESFQCEVDTILEFKYFGYELTNKTSGGEGISGLIHSEETKKIMSDSETYTFVHKNGEIFIGTRFDLSKNKNVPRLNISQMFSRSNVNSANGWGIKLDNESISQCIERISTLRSLAKSDQTKYKFVHKSGTSFIGTRFDLSKNYNLDLNRICELFSKKKRKSSQGWSIIGESYDDQS